MEVSLSMITEPAFQRGYCCWFPWPSCGSGLLGLPSAAVHGACDQIAQSLGHMAQVTTICPHFAGMISCFHWRIGFSGLHTRTLACESCPIYPTERNSVIHYGTRMDCLERVMWIKIQDSRGAWFLAFQAQEGSSGCLILVRLPSPVEIKKLNLNHDAMRIDETHQDLRWVIIWWHYIMCASIRHGLDGRWEFDNVFTNREEAIHLPIPHWSLLRGQWLQPVAGPEHCCCS